MGQKVRPTGFRTGIFIDWQSSWYASKADFSELLIEDFKIRKYLNDHYGGAGIAKIRIQRTREKVTVFVHSARVGVIIGKKGSEVDKLTNDLQNMFHRVIEVKTIEVNRPEVDAQLVAYRIADEMAKQQGFRRVMKKALEETMNAGAKGIRVQMAGRLGGSEMARNEKAMAGSIPLSTLRARIDYGFAEGKTAQGHIGVKVWINNGDFLNPEEDSDAANAQARQVPKKPAGRRKG